MQSERNYTLPGGLAVHRIQPAIGAVVSGIDLAKPLDEAHAADLRAALFAHGVIFLRGQEHIGFAEHLALAQVFGTPIEDGPDPQRPQITPVAAKAFQREGTASSWHSDGNYSPAPPSVSILRALDPCTFGGDTCFSSATAAYAGLDDETKEQIATLCAIAPASPNGFPKATAISVRSRSGMSSTPNIRRSPSLPSRSTRSPARAGCMSTPPGRWVSSAWTMPRACH